MTSAISISIKKLGKLLLHDISENSDTQLCEVVKVTTEEGEGEKELLGRPQISKTRRQCVVVLSPDLYRDCDRLVERQWLFKIRDAEPEKGKVIQITKLRPLGRGGQGEVHKVVDMYTGTHYACKIVAIQHVYLAATVFISNPKSSSFAGRPTRPVPLAQTHVLTNSLL
ncbi:hypothetical protein MKX08_010316 [Trichoderma sp. CBMAI-0020]|nr:hypothetical protein MKX08_010316 [Trichoderma sp. CBMAI-0020]